MVANVKIAIRRKLSKEFIWNNEKSTWAQCRQFWRSLINMVCWNSRNIQNIKIGQRTFISIFGCCIHIEYGIDINIYGFSMMKRD